MTTKNAARRGIPTTYAGTRFRSRLEARYAAFFDVLGWSWIYEPFDTDNWIPDFLVQGPGPFLVEVGPVQAWSEYHVKAEKALAAFPNRRGQGTTEDRVDAAVFPDLRLTLIVGTYPVVEIADHYPAIAAGLLTSDGRYAGTGAAAWVRCEVCGDPAVLHIDGVYRLLPCGHWSDSSPWVDEVSLRRAWNQASTPTQWRGGRGA